MDEIYSRVLELVQFACTGSDETELELAKDLADAAYDYTGYRYRENFYDTETRLSEDKARTIAHNHYMDTLNIFLRYEKTLGRDIPELPDDRKVLGDFGNRLIADLAIRRR